MHYMRYIAAISALTLAFSVGCSQQRASSPSVKNNVENSLNQAGFKDVKVSEDRNKGVVTLKGDVATQDDKSRAEEVARQSAGNSVVANELLVTEGDKSQAKTVAGDTDKAIEASFKAWSDKNQMKDIKSDAKNGVLTLTGTVQTASQRDAVEKDAAKIEGVQQVVNKLDIKAKHKGRATANTAGGR